MSRRKGIVRVFRMFGKLKEKIESEMQGVEDKRAIKAEKKALLIEEAQKHDEAKDFLRSLKALADMFFPYINPTNFDNFSEYKSLNEINFCTREDRYSKKELSELTGLTTLRYRGGWHEDRWEANYKEYVNVFYSSSSKTSREMQSALLSIHTKIESNEKDYSNFVLKYLDTLSNTIEIVEEYGINFILEDEEIFGKVKELIGSFVADYESYTGAVKEFKRSKVLEKLDMEQKYVDKMISNDTSFLLEFPQK